MNPEEFVTFPHTQVSSKIAVALGIGLLVGLERESANKDVGVRTFAIIGLLGMLTSLVGRDFAMMGLASVLALITYVNVRSIMVDRSLEITTSAALVVTCVLGILVGQGHVFTPVASAILMTALLAWKSELARFADGLLLEEIRSAVVLGLLTFVIYPLLPDHYIDPWQVINPREAWITVIALAGISFVNYILLKMYSTRGLYYGALLGGLVNSSAAVTELSSSIKTAEGRVLPRAYPIILLTTVAMFGRNLFLLAVFEPEAVMVALAPLAGMLLLTALFVYRSRRRHDAGLSPSEPLKVTSPVSVTRVLNYAVVFVVLEALGTLAQRYLGTGGVVAVSLVGGLFSSASATAAAAKLASQGKITPLLAGSAAVIASISSAFVNLPLVYQQTRDRQLVRNLALTSFICVLFGLVLMAFSHWVVKLGLG